jgi:hypothetical protein
MFLFYLIELSGTHRPIVSIYSLVYLMLYNDVTILKEELPIDTPLIDNNI